MTQFWHGGPRGLTGWILPPSETGAASTADFGADKVCKRHCVYITTNQLAARMFGSMAPAKKVSIYLVEPDEPIEPDVDCKEKGLSFEAPKARIIKEFPIRPSERLEMLLVLRP